MTNRITIATSQSTGLRATWTEAPHCCCCGTPITPSQILNSLDQWLAPCCNNCANQVKQEIFKYVPSWPANWHGHWSKTNSDSYWRQTQ